MKKEKNRKITLESRCQMCYIDTSYDVSRQLVLVVGGYFLLSLIIS